MPIKPTDAIGIIVGPASGVFTIKRFELKTATIKHCLTDRQGFATNPLSLQIIFAKTTEGRHISELVGAE